jgi:hypothetical protein
MMGNSITRAHPSVQMMANEASVHGSDEVLRRHKQKAGNSKVSQQRFRKSSMEKPRVTKAGTLPQTARYLTDGS